MTRFDAVLFDKDGTLIDTFPSWIRRERSLLYALIERWAASVVPADKTDSLVLAALRAIGIEGETVLPGSLLASGTELQLYESMHAVLSPVIALPDFHLFAQEARQICRRVISEDSLPPQAFPGGELSLRALQGRGITLGLATSDSWDNTKDEMKRLGWTDLWSYWGCGDRVIHPKPDPACFQEFCATVGTSANRVLVVGDSAIDEQFARNGKAGAFAAVLSGTSRKEDFVSPDFTWGSVVEVCGLFRD